MSQSNPVDEDSVASTSAAIPEEEAAAVPGKKRGRGRPKGSKNKPKDSSEGASAKKPRKSVAAKPAKEKPVRKRLSVKAVNEILKSHGVDCTGGRKVSQCLRAGIMRSKLKLLKPEDDPENKYGLDQILKEGGCISCTETVKCTVRDVLYQPDYGGMDYEDGGLEATVHCPRSDCGGIYVTRICQGNPTFDTGKFHNHCTKCPGFGSCIGDYREVHCQECGRHYFSTESRNECYKCHRADVDYTTPSECSVA